MNRTKSELLYKQALKYLPGGVNSPVRAFKSVGGTPLFISKGSGSKIIDEDSNEYIDFCMSWGPLILGHARKEVVEAIQQTATSGTSFGTPHRYEVEIAEKVISAYKSIDIIRFVNSGTEATMSAIRLARGYTGKDKIVKFDGCYHGHADFLLVAAGSGLATFGSPDSAGVTEGNAKDTIILPYNNIDAVKKYLSENSNETAAIILEPVACNYGLIIPGKEYLQELRKLCTEKNVLLIFDEVITGFRLSSGGAQKYFDVEADITTLGKIIGGGLPVGAYGGKKEIMKKIAPDGEVYQAGTLSGNPLAMAAGIAMMKIISDSNFYSDLKNKAELFYNELKPALDKYKGKVNFSQIESIFAFNFTDIEEIKTLDDVKSGNMEIYGNFHKELLENGVYFAPSGYEVGFLSAAHSDEDIKEAAKIIKNALDKVLA